MSGELVFRDLGGWISGPCLDPEQQHDPLAAYRGRWEIEIRPGGLDVLAAVRRSTDGRHIRMIVAQDAEELADKLDAAETEELAR